MKAELPLPPFYRPEHAEQFSYRPDLQRLQGEAAQWRRQHRIPEAAADPRRVNLLLIDAQKDFCFPEGTLYVGGRSGRGALDDNRRTTEFIYRNLQRLTAITTTHDTHHAFQIFFASFWVDAEGEPLSPHREITVAEIEAGRVRPRPEMAAWLAGGDETWLQRYVRHYCEQLERAGKHRLYLWPPHCILGSDGHALVGALLEARLFHSYTRIAQSWGHLKGSHPLTEHYSALRPEVSHAHDGFPLGEPNAELLRALLDGDALVIAGQAASHCVRSTVEDLLAAIEREDPALAHRVYLLTDCMSSVAVPDGADFTESTEKAFARFEAAGMRLIRSDMPMEEWI